MNPIKYLQKFFAELERLVDCHGTPDANTHDQRGSDRSSLRCARRHRSCSMTIRSGRHKPLLTLIRTSLPASDPAR